MRTQWLWALTMTAGLWAQAPRPAGSGLEAGVLPAKWTSGGPHCMEAQEFQIHQYNPDFYILRQSGCTDYEKPFLYLIFGREKALLWDTGSRNARTRETVDRVIERWLQVRKRERVELIVLHSHLHSDHIAGDAQFADRPQTTFVKAGAPAVKAFFKIRQWPEETAQFDLGDRVLEIVPIPGHSDDSHAIYDRRTGILLTGDSVYPGRLYVSNFGDFKSSIHRLAVFTEGKLIAHVLGCHIEQTRTPYLDYPIGKLHQPDEHELALSVGHILELDRALAKLDRPQRLALRDLTIYPIDEQSLAEMKAIRKRTEEADRTIVWPQSR